MEIEEPSQIKDSKNMSVMLSVDDYLYDQFVSYQKQVEIKADRLFSEFDPLKYSTESYKGMIYYIKYKISDDEWGHIHVRMHQHENPLEKPKCEIVSYEHTL